jgi:hypothetical protein
MNRSIPPIKWFRRRLEGQRRLQASFDQFLEESKASASMRRSKHPEAALYRHAWRRAVVLESLSQRLGSNENRMIFGRFRDLAARRYWRVAPTTPYGAVRLKLTPKMESQIAQRELRILREIAAYRTLPSKWNGID